MIHALSYDSWMTSGSPAWIRTSLAAKALCNNAAVHTPGWRAIRCHRAGLLIVVLALAAPAMNLAMGAVHSFSARPAAAVTDAQPASVTAENDCTTTERPSGSPVRLIQKARGVLVHTVVLSDATVMPPGAAPGQPPLAYRSVAIPAAPQIAGQPHRGPPSAKVARSPQRHPHGVL
jgi:hypothetical protein